MALGPGKYDDELTEALESIRRRTGKEIAGGILIVRGEPGYSSFCSQLPLEDQLGIPDVLRQIADQIERDTRKGNA